VRAVVVHETGGPEVLKVEEVPEPQPAEGEVLVRLEAIGVNHYDLSVRAGMAPSLPVILGKDGAGRRQDTGERVLVTNADATYAELAAVPEDIVWPIPDSLDSATAAALGVAYRTAWWSVVELGGLKEGDTLLVQAASSGTGQAAVDIGRALGARVVATAGQGKLDQVRELGAEAVPYGDESLRSLGANVVFDPVGGETLGESVEALGRQGVVVTPGAVGNPQATFSLWSLIGKQARIQGAGNAPATRELVERLISMAAEGKLRPVIDRQLPLEQAAEAHRAIEARETFGKVILTVGTT
jgi:NADPH:quinone reductase-like Zn-dependent oxidoreductase